MFTMLLVNALQAAGALVDLFAGFSLADDLRPVQQRRNVAIFGRFYELLATTLLFTTERVPHPRERLLPLVRRDPRAAGSSISDDLDAAHEEPGPVPRRRDRDRGPDPRVPVPRRDHARPARRAPRRTSTCSRSRSRCASSSRSIVVALALPARSRPRSATSCATRSRRSATDAEPERDRWPPDSSQKTETPTPRRPQGGAREGPDREVARPLGVGRDARDDRAAPDDASHAARPRCAACSTTWASRSRIPTRPAPCSSRPTRRGSRSGSSRRCCVGMMVDRRRASSLGQVGLQPDVEEAEARLRPPQRVQGHQADVRRRRRGGSSPSRSPRSPCCSRSRGRPSRTRSRALADTRTARSAVARGDQRRRPRSRCSATSRSAVSRSAASTTSCSGAGS